MKDIKAICKEYGFTQTRLAERFGIPLRTVQDWYAGRRKPPVYVLTMMDEILKLSKEDIRAFCLRNNQNIVIDNKTYYNYYGEIYDEDMRMIIPYAENGFGDLIAYLNKQK